MSSYKFRYHNIKLISFVINSRAIVLAIPFFITGTLKTMAFQEHDQFVYRLMVLRNGACHSHDSIDMRYKK